MTCKRCSEPPDGLDGEHCQDHWEQVASEGFWEYVKSPEYAVIELMAELQEQGA